MQLAFRLSYAIVVAILLILFAILGVRTIYAEPEAPPYPVFPGAYAKDLYCDPVGACYRDGQLMTSEEEAALSEVERQYISDVRRYPQLQREYVEEREDYRRNVLVASAALGALAVACGLYLYRRVDAMPLGVILGGLGIVSYGWAQAGDQFDEMGPTVPFVAVGLGLAAVLAAGYWFLGRREPRET